MKIYLSKKSIFQPIMAQLLYCVLGLGIAMQVSAITDGGISDTTPPELVSFSIDPDPIDLTMGDEALHISIGFLDDLSGFNYARITLESPSGAQQIDELISSSGISGTAERDLFLSSFSESGFWRVAALELRDQAGNTVFFHTNDLQAFGFPFGFEVISFEDLDPPVIQSIDYSTTHVNVSAGPQDVTIGMRITDPAGVNLDGFVLAIRSSLYSQTEYVGASEFALISGDEFDGTWQGTATFPQHSEDGDWQVTISNLHGIKDSAGNQVTMSLAELGLIDTIQVASATPDITPPEIFNLDFTPKAINTSAGPVEISVTMQLQDDLSGLSFETDAPSITFVIGAEFRSPSGGQTVRQSTFGGHTLSTGTALDGTWDGPITMRQFSESGTWSLSTIRLKDKTNNKIAFSEADLQALGLDTKLVVIRPSLEPDETIGPEGGIVIDDAFPERANLTIPAGLLTEDSVVSIDVFSSPLDVPTPEGFSADGTLFVNVSFNPQPSFPVAAPGMTVVLPFTEPHVPGSLLTLFKLDTTTATLVPSISVSGTPVIGTVNADGLSATFSGVAGFSTVIGLPAIVDESILGDLNGDFCVDRSDARLLLGLIRSREPISLIYDLNDDGLVNISDARKLITMFDRPRGASCDIAL